MENNLQITVQTKSGALTVTPLSLLQFYMPGAKPMADNPQIYYAPNPSKPSENIYFFVETLHGILMTARDKHLNPISEIYALPSNSPTKKSGFKIKYDAAIERLRNVPGFLGLDFGVMVERDKDIISRSGEMAYPGDRVIGAWAEGFITGLSKPIRHEVGLDVKGFGPRWEKNLNAMLCKCAVNHLVTRKIVPIYAAPEKEGEGILLEAQVPEVVMGGGNGAPAGHEQGQTQPAPASPFVAGTEYVGTILRARPHEGRRPGAIEFAVDGEKVVCFFWKTPTMLEGVNLDSIITTTAVFSFTEKPGQNGTTDRLLATFVLESAPEATASDFDHQAGPAVEPEKENSNDRM